MKKIIYCFVLLSLLLSACSDNLSKGKAENIIADMMINPLKYDEYGKTNAILQYPWYLTLYRGGGYETHYSVSKGLSPWLSFDQLKQLKNEGYLLIYKEEQYNIHGNNDLNVQSFTEKAKPFLTFKKLDGNVDAYYLQLATIDKVVVTSISKPRPIPQGTGLGIGAKEYEVKYEVKVKPNALGEKLQISPDDLIVKICAQIFFSDKVWKINYLYHCE